MAVNRVEDRHLEAHTRWGYRAGILVMLTLLHGCSSETEDDSQGDNPSSSGSLRLVSSQTDSDMDGVIDRIITENYDANGLATFSDELDVRNSNIESRTSYVNNEDGSVGEYRVDIGNDGSVDGTTTISYYSPGMEETFSSSNRFNGLVGTSTTLYDSAGRWSGRFVDVDGDGVTDTAVQNIYDDAGNLIRKLIDQDMDNVADNAYHYELGTSGEHRRLNIDAGNDGVIDSTIRYEYEQAACSRIQFGASWGTRCR